MILKRIAKYSYLSYMIIIFPIIILLIVMTFGLFYYENKNNFIKNSTDSLIGMQKAFDVVVSDMNLNATEMLDSADFSTSKITTKYGSFLGISRRLSSYVSYSKMINNVFYINNDLKTVYTLGKPYTYEDFYLFNDGYNITKDTYAQFFLKNILRFWIPAQNAGANGEQVLTYVVTYNGEHNYPSNALVVHIGTEKLDELFDGFLPNSQAEMLVLDNNNSILYSTLGELSQDIQKSLISINTDSLEPKYMDYNKKQYLVLTKPSTETPITYALIIPTAVMLKSMNASILFFAILMVVVALISIFVIAALLKASRKNRAAMLEQIALKLVQSNYGNQQALQDDIRTAGLERLGPHFQVATAMLTAKYPIQNQLIIYQEISRLIEKELPIHPQSKVLTCSSDDLIYVVFSGQKDIFASLIDALCEMKPKIESLFQVFLSIGVGSASTIDNIGTSAEQARIANKYRFVKGENAIIYFENINKQNSSKLIYPSETIELFYNVILQREEEKINLVLTTLIEHISRNNSLFFGTCLAYDIVNTSLKAMRELNYSLSNFKNTDIYNRDGFKSIDDVKNVLNLLIEEIIATFSSEGYEQDEVPESSKHSLLINQMKKHIEENCIKSDFSINSLADNYKMSISNLSHYFKKQTGENVSDFVLKLRVDRAKFLLRTTKLTLQKISQECGYVHISTFLRQFRQSEKMTPSNYRSSFGVKEAAHKTLSQFEDS
ncbi:AraC family transcriptional regulator [Paenibacillus agricola]|uniref:Helix-turn-helix transcriptional regulator n=1 Tax=Paenibacillus agricola TaxID=2716264 RepID=A0ABX0J8P4_9BACL|nr:AraC family transcriptional regulator [Paenibacillus agricola]NHN32522.1 helix-turn-helix transcriptional regulator [Paenibacillus agricola]